MSLIHTMAHRLALSFPKVLEEQPLWEELYIYFRDKYFTIDFGTFQNFSFTSGGLITISGVIYGIMTGAIIASAVSVFQHNHLGDFIRALLMDACTTPEKAQTLEALGFSRATAVRSQLRRGHTLRRAVRTVEGDAYEKSIEEKRKAYQEAHGGSDKGFVALAYKVDLDHDHFYIPEESKYAVDVKFEKQNHGCLTVFLATIGMLLLAVLITVLLPDVLHLLDNFISLMNS